MSTASAPALLTTKEVAALLRVHPKQVYRLMKRGLPALRVGDEWRFSRDEVVRWASSPKRARGGNAVEAAPSALRNEPSAVPTGGLLAESSGVPTEGLIAANGDWAIEVLLAHVREREGTLFGLVLSDHARSRALLQRRRVLAAGSHASLDGGEDQQGAGPLEGRTARLHLVTREVGLAMRTRSLRHLGAIVGKRIATRPATAGIRVLFDRALSALGIDPSVIRKGAVEHACHRDVTLAVAQGQADVGLTTHAWAHTAGLTFLPLAREDYELRFAIERIGDPRIIAICNAVQSGRFRRDLRAYPGYGVTRTGRLRVG